ncbi:MICOS complex subunit MIC26-like [Solea senegalensis]|uniref:MICOS complex subunit n=1 Tax=Solea senegalensis TaxID=28829 RepID=A0AAV6T3L5_SOLSE|nr:MICOS complex subunit MIC26-like [Solea senegalensis]KAG7524055.1 MICOS complex subunit MIC26-like [Solea senegalensis]
MLKVTAGTSVMSGRTFLSPFTVFAAAAAGDGERGASVPLLQLEDLSLYAAAPRESSPASVEPEAGELEQSVATLRKLVEPYTAWCQDTYNTIEPRVQSVLQRGYDTYAYLQNPPKDFYPRAGVIGFTGVLGLLLARRSRAKRLIYPAGLMSVSASLYYPEKAAAIVKTAGDSVYERAVHSYAAVEKMLNPQSKGEKVTGSETKP